MKLRTVRCGYVCATIPFHTGRIFMKRFWPAIVGVVLAAILAGCVTYVPVAEAGKPISRGSVVVTGKISFEPKLVQKWGVVDFAVKAAYERKAFVLLSKKPVTSLESIQKADQVIGVERDKYFHLYLNSPFKITFHPGDRFVYLGDSTSTARAG